MNFTLILKKVLYRVSLWEKNLNKSLFFEDIKMTKYPGVGFAFKLLQDGREETKFIMT